MDFFRHNFVVFADGDAITNMIMLMSLKTLVGSGFGINHSGSARIRNPDFMSLRVKAALASKCMGPETFQKEWDGVTRTLASE